MCGISGFVVFNQEINLSHHLFKMNEILKHRGGDDEGYVFFNDDISTECVGDRTPENVTKNLPYVLHKNEFNQKAKVGLSHNRLSIIDVSHHGHQPMSENTQRYWITFNGEIYNYQEIRDELINLGYTFHSQTDTEVVLNSFMEWGEQSVKKFNGMWAFCIYDRVDETLFLSRDRFGVKPLYYRLEKDFICFASEIKALVKIDDSKDTFNKKAVFQYLALGLVESEQEGLIQNIFELKPAHNLKLQLENGKVSHDKYYQLDFNKEWVKTTLDKENKYISDLKILIKNSIKKRLTSDVKIGSCLSGGIDSSAIVGFIDEILDEGENIQSIGSKLKVFTSCFAGELDNEENWAKAVVDKSKTEWFKIFPTSDDFIKCIQDCVFYQDIPFFGASTFAQYCVMKLINSNGIKVTLDGQGADELFGGYDEFYSSFLINSMRNRDFLTFSENMTFHGLKLPLKHYFLKSLPIPILSPLFKWFNPELKYLNPIFWKKFQGELVSLKENFVPNLNKSLHTHLTGEKFKNLLRTADRNSMRFSVESRMPFADDIELIEYIFHVPSSFKIKKKSKKYLLREAAKNVLPRKIYERKDKIAFSAPEKKWIAERANELLNFIPKKNDEFVQWEKVRKDWFKLVNESQVSANNKLWRLINFAIWMDVNKY
jgi:asparagine synthase (glutamine-hydrolysing)